MNHGRFRFTAYAALGMLILAGCKGSVNDDSNFFALTFRASLDPNGTELAGPSDRSKISTDGRYVVFQTRASNLVSRDVNGKFDIYRKDLTTGAVLRVSVEAFDDGDPVDGNPFNTSLLPFDPVTSTDHNPNQDCLNPAITPDGRFVVFQSISDDLANDDPQGFLTPRIDIFRRDLVTGETLWISEPVGGQSPNGDSINATISDDGRYVAFESDASNLVFVDGGGVRDVFVRDTLFGTTVLVSSSAAGVPGNLESKNAAISGDGQRVAFDSQASNLVAADDGSNNDVFVKAWLAALPTVTRVSVEGTGEPDGDPSDLDNADGSSAQPCLSQDGRFVAFLSVADDLIGDDNNQTLDVFIRDTLLGTTARVSVSSRGGEASQASFSPQISRDGRWVTFHSATPDLIPADTNNAIDIFLRDTVVNSTIRISVATYGVESSPFFDSAFPSVSGDGRFVAFTSLAPNLAPDDTNGTSDIYIRGPLY